MILTQRCGFGRMCVLLRTLIPLSELEEVLAQPFLQLEEHTFRDLNFSGPPKALVAGGPLSFTEHGSGLYKAVVPVLWESIS